MRLAKLEVSEMVVHISPSEMTERLEGVKLITKIVVIFQKGDLGASGYGLILVLLHFPSHVTPAIYSFCSFLKDFKVI